MEMKIKLEVLLLLIFIYLFVVSAISFFIRSLGDYCWFRYRLYIKGGKRGIFQVLLGALMSPGTLLVKTFKPVYYHQTFDGEKRVKYIPKPK